MAFVTFSGLCKSLVDGNSKQMWIILTLENHTQILRLTISQPNTAQNLKQSLNSCPNGLASSRKLETCDYLQSLWPGALQGPQNIAQTIFPC